MKVSKLTNITSNKLIVTEGQDDENLLFAVMKHLGLDEIQVINCEGNSDLTDKIRTIAATHGFRENVRSLGIVRDAELNSEGAFQSVCNALSNSGLGVPDEPLKSCTTMPRTTVLIWPHKQEAGKLEDICLQSIYEFPEMSCIDDFFECLKAKDIPEPNDISKAKVKAFLASRQESVPHLGIAASKGYFPLDNAAFDDVKTFLRML
ncbi:DUF3226 domain-containing protein [Chloroflexota bacterium]